MRLAILAAGLSIALGAVEARADDITDQITEALKAYQNHDLATAAAALDAAANLLRQSKAENWKRMLPEPLPGWTAQDAESTSVATAILGGGTSVSRTYRNAGHSVEISFIADSPIMAGVGSLLNSGLMTGGDAKLLIIDGRKVTFNKTDDSYVTVAGKVLVTVKGHGVDDATLRSYWKAIKFAELEKGAS